MNDAVIRISGLVKDYGAGRRLRRAAPVRALDGVDLQVDRGEVFGFLGPNGAGKTTTIRILLDQLRPTAGDVEVLGETPLTGGPALRRRIGYLPGELRTQGRATAGALLQHLARLRGAGGDRIAPLAERLTLDLDRPIRSLSKGNKQKVGLIQAFMHEPELLILDEPTSGLDPLLQQEFLAMAREANDAGTTVFMSSHVLSEVEAIAERVAIVRAGVIVDLDDVTTLRHHAGQRVEIVVDRPIDGTPFAALPGVTEVATDGRSLTCLLHGEPDALIKAAAAHHVERLTIEDRELEDLFLDFYRMPVHDEPEEVGADGR